MTKKIKQTCTYVTESLDKVRSKEWAAPVACALNVTGSIVQGVGNFVPGFGILGGAFKLGSNLLNPQPNLSDLRKSEKCLRLDIEQLRSKSVSTVAIESLSKDLERVQAEITNYKESNSELIEDFARLKLDVRDQFKNMSREMKNIENDVKELKDIVTATFELIVDQRYKEGLESIEAAYDTFLDGANNLEATLISFDYYIIELQTNFNQHLKPEKIEEYLRIIKNHNGADMCHQMFNYILVVKSKYLQIMTVYYIHKKDVSRVTAIFERFNEHYFELKKRLEIVLKEKNKVVQYSIVSATETINSQSPRTQPISTSSSATDLKVLNNGSILNHMTHKLHMDQNKRKVIFE